jgi:hypothetical protein
MLKDVITVSVFNGIQCSLNNFELSATIMTNSSTDELGRRVRHSQNPPETQQELHYAFVHEWNNIPQAFIQRLIGFMRRRCETVVAARGGHTRY